MTENYYKILIETDTDYQTNEKCNRSDLKGLEYVKYLRRVDKDKTPVLFTSFLPVSDLYKLPHAQLLKAVGHKFIQLPYTEAELKNIESTLKPLTDIQLKDVIFNFCEQKSFIREGFHALKGTIRKYVYDDKLSKAEKNENVTKTLLEFRNQLLANTIYTDEILKAFDETISGFKIKGLPSINHILDAQEEVFTKFLPGDADDSEAAEENQFIKEKSWKILFLDDEPEQLNPIFNELKKRKIDYEYARNYADAQKIINEDKYNEIVITVCDYRINDENGCMLDEQGYDFLIWLSKQNRFNSLIALSGLSKWFLMDSFRKEQINAKVYSKNNVINGGEKSFIDDLEYLGDNIFNVICSLPTTRQWNFDEIKNNEIECCSLQSIYIYHRNHLKYETNEREINEKAEKVAREIEYAMDNSADLNAVALISVVGNTTKNLKGHYHNDPDELDREYNEYFILKLTQRRVFLYLLLKGFDREKIATLLHKGNFYETVGDSMIKQVILKLGLSPLSDIPYHILIEEKYFLEKYMGVPIYNIAELMDQTHIFFNEKFNKLLARKPQLKEQFSNYIVQNPVDGQYFFQSVNVLDAHTLLKKLGDFLIQQNEINQATGLCNEIMIVLNKILDLLNSSRGIGESLKKSIGMIDDYLLKIANQNFR